MTKASLYLVNHRGRIAARVARLRLAKPRSATGSPIFSGWSSCVYHGIRKRVHKALLHITGVTQNKIISPPEQQPEKGEEH